MRRTLRIPCLLVISMALGALGGPVARSEDNPSQRELVQRIESLQEHNRLTIDGVRITAVKLIETLYAQSRFELVWTDPQKVDDLLRAIDDIHLDGLNPQDYYLDRLKKMRAELADKPGTARRVDFDILLTDAMARLAYNAFYGKVDPERIDPHINVQQDWTGERGAALATEFLASDSLYQKIEELKPTHPAYQRYREALAAYRRYQEAGGWKKIPSGKVLKEGRSDPRVSAIRRRLAMTGDLPTNLDNGDPLYDAEVEQAVHRFQERHRLPTGDFAKKTIDAMNVPVEHRIDQIRVNLERVRWVTRGMPPTRIVVNIAAFEIFFVKDNEVVWRNEAQVGKTHTQTPLYMDDIEYLVLNPTWTVPPGVLKETVLPEAKKDWRYIKKRELRVIDKSGKEVSPKSVDWKRYNASNFPYTLRQDPGRKNPLGEVKFIFPNQYHVYLHDTPNQLGYGRRLRAMSWGCIHVQDPLELAEWAIDDRDNWDLKSIQAQVRSRKTKTIHFKEPVPVRLFYWTVEIEEDGEVQFLTDIYQRDRRVLRALNGPFKLRKTYRRGEEAPD